MEDGGPFRERPKFLLCPRCGEMLERAFDAVLVCLRCEGVWLATVTLEKAFGNPRWPQGQNAWWRSQLGCPECATSGTTTIMGAVMVEGLVLVDRCDAHGLWLDRGELGRLMGSTTDDDDLTMLRDRLALDDAELDRLAERRNAWRTDVEIRRKSAAEYKQWLEVEQRRRDEIAQAERERLKHLGEQTREVERREELSTAARISEHEADRAEREAEAARKQAERDAERLRKAAIEEHTRAIQRLGDARAQARQHAAQIESRIILLREQLREAEAELVGARVRARAVDDQLLALERQRV